MNAFIGTAPDIEWDDAHRENDALNENTTARQMEAAKAFVHALMEIDPRYAALTPNAVSVFSANILKKSLVNFASSIDLLGLSPRSKACLIAERIHTVGELVQRTETDLLKSLHIGRNTLNEIKTVLAGYDWSLEMDIGSGFGIKENQKGSSLISEKNVVKTPVSIYDPVSVLNLPTRASNCLKALNIHYVGELIQLTVHQLQSRPNFGEQSLRNIEEALASSGRSLGTKLSGWISPILSAPISDLGWQFYFDEGKDICKCLELANISYVGELVQKTDAEVIGLSIFVGKHIGDIRHVLGKFRLSLGMKLNNWTRPNNDE